MNIFVITALMQLLPLFEKHSPGISFLSKAMPIISFAKIKNVKRYLITYPYLSDYGQTIFCLLVHPIEVGFKQAYCSQFMNKVISDYLFKKNRQSDSPPL
jgi:hypothetical protein